MHPAGPLLCWLVLLLVGAQGHTLESNSPPVWKSHALCTLDEASVYRGCLQAAILATSPIMPTDVFHLRGALL